MSTTIPADLLAQFIEQGIQKGLIQDVTPTLDGQHYLDFDYLKKSVSTEVETHGKINVESLSDIFSVEQYTIEKAIEGLLLDNKDYTVMDDLILTQNYMNELEKKIEDQLLSRGSISLVAQAQQMKLPYSLSKLIMESIDREEEKYVRYSQLPDVISTSNYIETVKTKIFEALKSAEEPIQLFKLQKPLGIVEDMFYLLVEQIAKDKDFTLGAIRGKRSRAVFEPKAYKERQLSLIQSIFDSNACISLHTIENLYPYSNATDLIADIYEKGTYLSLTSCIIKSSIKDAVKQAMESVTEYYDLNDHLPSNLTYDDVSNVMDIIGSEINASSANHKKLIVLDGGFVTTPEYINKTVLQTNSYLRNLGRTLRQERKSEPVAAIKMSTVMVMKALESTGCPHIIANKILPYTRAAVANQFADILQAPYLDTEEIVSADKWVIEYKSREFTTLSNVRKSIYFNYKAIQLFKDASAKKSLEKFLLKSQFIDYLYHFVLYLILSQSFNKAEVTESTSLCITMEDIEKQSIVDAKEQKCVITYFIRENDHRYDKTSVIQIEEIIKKKRVDLFISEILMKDKQGLFKHEQLDSPETRSTANNIIFNQLHNQLEALKISADSAPQLLHLTSLLIFQKLFQIPLYVSGKFVPMILAEIESKLKPEQQELLEIAHLSIINNNREEHLDDYKKLKDLGINCTL